MSGHWFSTAEWDMINRTIRIDAVEILQRHAWTVEPAMPAWLKGKNKVGSFQVLY